MTNILIKFIRSVKERGWKGTAVQLYLIGDIKNGVLKGTDKFGNKYYEDLNEPYGQHRWVEYANIHNYDASMIQPEWHGWMHHVFDETPDEQLAQDSLKTVEESDAIYSTHVGKIGENVPAYEQVDVSQYRHRGFNIGSLMIGANEPERYYKQPGHPLSDKVDKGGRFKDLKNLEEWDPNQK
eukprot:gene8819-11908_t